MAAESQSPEQSPLRGPIRVQGIRPVSSTHRYSAQSQAFVAALIDSAQQDRGRLEAAVDSIITVATVTPTDPPIVMRAYEVEATIRALAPGCFCLCNRCQSSPASRGRA